jgi:hypothetical protein
MLRRKMQMLMCDNCGREYNPHDIDYLSYDCKDYCPDCISECRECGQKYGTCEGYDGYCPDCTYTCDRCGAEMSPDDYFMNDGLCDFCEDDDEEDWDDDDDFQDDDFYDDEWDDD